MSSPMNTALLAAMRSDQRRPVSLYKIELTTPSALTFYVASAEVMTPDGQLWESGGSGGHIRQEIAPLGTGPNPASTTVYLENRRYSLHGATEDIGSSLSDYLWQGATVTLYLWERSLSSFTTPAEFQRFRGTVDSYALDDLRLTLNCLQDRSWNKPVPTLTVDQTNYPNAPDGQQGGVIPVVYGSHIAPPLRSPHAAAYTNKSYHEDSGAGSGAIPLILTDPGTGSADVQLVAASHALGDLLSRSTGYSAFMVAGDVLAPLDTAGITETLTGPSYLTIDDDTLIAYYGARAIDVRTTGGGAVNSALNPRRAMDVFNETTYATLNQTAGTDQEKLVLVGPNLGALGTIESATVILCFSGDAANTQNIRVYPEELGVSSGTVISAASTGTTPQIVTGTWDTAYYDASTWQFGTKPSTGGQCCWSVDFAGASANNKARIYWLAVRVKYRPSRNLITPAVQTPGRYVQERPRGRGGPTSGRQYVPGPTIPEAFALSGQFFSHAKGYADDGSGTYTGSAAATIERPCDIARHFLTTYGAASSFETGATAFGSFVNARNLLKNASPNDFKLAAWMGEASSVQRYLQKMCEQSLMCVVQDTFTDKWLCHVWKQGAAVDYDLVFTRNELPDLFEPSLTSSVSLTQGVRVRYGYDYFRNRTQYECYVGPSGSSQGYNLPTTRDQVLSVTVNNRKLDWKVTAGTTYADTLTIADYSAIDLAEEVQTQMMTHYAGTFGNPMVKVGYGFTIKTGFNDAVEFYYGASNYSATLDAGAYTADTLAIAAAAKMNAAVGLVGVIGCSYSQSTNKFTFTSSGSAAGLLSYLSRGAGWNQCANYTLGFDGSAAFPVSSTWACYADRFFVRASGDTVNLLFSTGTNVATCCRDMLGWTVADTGLSANQVASYARGDRETTCATSQTLYGPRADAIITADWIKDEASAQQRRDREFDFGSAPRVQLVARTHFAPDLQVMRVIGISSDMDTRRPYPKYGTDGSWAGKPLRVLSVLHDNGPSYHTEFVAEEA